MKVREFFRAVFSRYLLANLLAMVAVGAFIVFLISEGLNIYTRHGEEITVPSLRGMSMERARLTLEQEGLKCVVTDSGYIASKKPGVVLDQSIAAGSRVKAGREVDITVNAASPPTIVMPDIVDNSSMREAESRLRAMGFSLAPPQYINGEREWVYGIKAGGREVTAGTRVRITERLTLVVGNGLTDDDMHEEDSLETEWNYGEDINYDDATGGEDYDGE